MYLPPARPANTFRLLGPEMTGISILHNYIGANRQPRLKVNLVARLNILVDFVRDNFSLFSYLPIED